MRSVSCVLLALVAITSLAWGRVVFNPEAFLKLPGRRGEYTFFDGTAHKAAYDYDTNLMYVVGQYEDTLNIVDMRTSMTNPPAVQRTIVFSRIGDGLPTDVKVCRGGVGREYLAIAFRSLYRRERGHVQLYGLLADPQDAFIEIKTDAYVEGYDPDSIAWNNDCTELVTVSRGYIHVINGEFEDPRPAIDILVPSFGLNIDRRHMPFSDAAIKAAGVRQVFTQCDSGTDTKISNHIQDIEPRKVVVDDNNVAYMLFTSNNAMGRMDLKNTFEPLSYYDLGIKDWRPYRIDTSKDDGGINLNSHDIKSLYQPQDAVVFTFANKTWLATADTGYIKQYDSEYEGTTLCNFDESAAGTDWNGGFTSFISQSLQDALIANMSAVESTGNMRFSRLKTLQDGYNPLQQGYNGLLTYGGRGWSLFDTTDMSRVYDSGDIFETYYESAEATDEEKAVFNSKYDNRNDTQSQQADATSPEYGPRPTAIATGNIDGTQVVAIANGNVGGLYIFSISTNSSGGPFINFEGFGRRGSPGLSWVEAYNQTTDAVGEPFITDLLWIEDEGQHVVAAISAAAGAVSFYSVTIVP